MTTEHAPAVGRNRTPLAGSATSPLAEQQPAAVGAELQTMKEAA